MAVGFGFSVGDICLSFKIIKDSVGALDNFKGAAADYSNLITEIQNVEEGLEAVQDLQKSSRLSEKQNAVLDRLLIDCQENVQNFLMSISKYQPHLTEDATALHSKFRKIKWALCKNDDVAKFREQLARQASSISMLIITFQAKECFSVSKVTHDLSTVAKREPAQEKRVIEILSTMSLEQCQCFMTIMQQNEELMQTVRDMRSILHMQASIPSQILFQQPVILLDPFGKYAPFHLEFVDSKESFIAVMKVRFAYVGIKPPGLIKLDEEEFSLEHTKRKKTLDLNRRWESIWKPGDQYNMRMVFHRFTCQSSPPNTCPSCNEVNEEEEGEEGEEGEEEKVRCHACGLQYQKLQGIGKQSSEWNRHFPKDAAVSISGEEIPYILCHPTGQAQIKVFRPSTEPEEESFEGYRRVQIISQSLALLDERYPALLLIRDFVQFAELVMDLPNGVSFYQDAIMQLQSRAMQYISEQQDNLPPFSSFSQIEEMRQNLTNVSRCLRQDIDFVDSETLQRS